MLPDDIEVRILSYLHLEFGEDGSDNNALKPSELKYVGEFLVDSAHCHFWEFPCMGEVAWVIAKPLGGEYAIGTYHIPPYTFKRVRG